MVATPCAWKRREHERGRETESGSVTKTGSYFSFFFCGNNRKVGETENSTKKKGDFCFISSERLHPFAIISMTISSISNIRQ